MLIHIFLVIALLPFTLGQSYVALAEYRSADCADGSIQSAKAFPTGCSLYINSFVSGRQSIKHVCNGTSIEVYECTDSNCQSCTLRNPPAADFTCYSDSGSYWKRTCAASVSELPAMPDNSVVRQVHWYSESNQPACALPGTYFHASVNEYCEEFYYKYTCSAQYMGASSCSLGDCMCSGNDTIINWNQCYNDSPAVAIGCVGLYVGSISWPRYVPAAPQSPTPAPVAAPMMPPAQNVAPVVAPTMPPAQNVAPVAAPIMPPAHNVAPTSSPNANPPQTTTTPVSAPVSSQLAPQICKGAADISGRIIADPVVPTDLAILSSLAWQSAKSRNETRWCCTAMPTLSATMGISSRSDGVPADSFSCRAARERWIVSAICGPSSQNFVSFRAKSGEAFDADRFSVKLCSPGCKILANACGFSVPDGVSDTDASLCPFILDVIDFDGAGPHLSYVSVTFAATDCHSASALLAPSLVLVLSVVLMFAVGIQT